MSAGTEDQASLRDLNKKNGGRQTLGILLASLNTGASRALWTGLLDAAEQHDVNLISFPGGRLNASAAFESQRNLIFELASDACVDGLITWASSLGGILSTSDVNAFHNRYQSLPMVSLAQFMEGYPTIALESYQGMRELLKHLITVHEFTRIAFIRGPEEHYYAQERYSAYLDTFRSYNLDLIPELVTCPLDWNAGAEAIRILVDERGLKPGIDFQAVVAVSDMMAVEALKALRARGIDVPDKVALTGFNNSIEERLATPALTSVDLPFYRQGVRSVDSLLEQLAGHTVPALLTLPSSLVIRQSCGCPSPAVRDAAYLPPEEAREDRHPLVRLRTLAERNQCLAELLEAAGNDLPPTFLCQIESLLDSLLMDLQQLLEGGAFIQQLNEVLNQAAPGFQDVNLWNRTLSVLRRNILPGLSTAERAVFEAVIGQARVIISEADQRTQAFWKWQSERDAELLRETNLALMTTFNISHLADVLCEHLPGLGIPSAYLVLYDNPIEPMKNARLIMAYTNRGRVVIDPEGWHFPTAQLIPPEFLPHDHRYSLVVEPLYFQQKPLGYAVFENGPHNGDIYELVRSGLSSAIQGAMLFDEIQQARYAAEKADRVKTHLLTNVSHELRAPLNIILRYTQNLLLSQNVEATLRDDILGIQSHAEHQLRVVNDLLDLTRAEIDELDLVLELIDPRPLFAEALHAIADPRPNQNVDWRLNVPDHLPLIQADTLRLRQILLNLLNNASKFTERGWVELGAEVVPPYFHFWVSDTGRGISPELQERIFDPFVSSEQSHPTGGIGLGLSITRHLVNLHNGRMTLDSEEGRGSKFHVYMPLPAVEQGTFENREAKPVLLLLSSRSILSEKIKNIAERQNLQICLVSNRSELDTALVATRPAAVAWDIANARPGDWNLVRRLRHHPNASQCPFILFGQYPESELRDGSLSMGLTGFVNKSPGPQTVLDAVNSLCPSDPIGGIMIVDDDPEVCAAYQKMIEQEMPGLSLRIANNGSAAFSMMEQEIPALVLLDLVMPEMSGADVLDQMRTDPRLRQVPVIILSNKLLTLEDVKRLEQHSHVILQSKGVWSNEEMVVALNRSLFGGESLPPQTSILVKRAVAFLHQNFNRPLSRWEVADAVGASEDYLSRVFTRELDISPWDYLNRFRILRAQMLLRSSLYSIAEIAHQVGFKDQAYFSRVFNKITGSSPNEYRSGTRR